MNELRQVDYAIVATYFGVVLLIAVLSRGKAKNTEEYFLAGRSMGWIPIALSVFATLSSSISFLGAPGESFRYNLELSLTLFIGVVIGVPITVAIVRRFYSMGLCTCYEFLERRFDRRISITLACVYILRRLLWMGMMLYGLSLVINVMTGLALAYIIVAVGVFSILYTSVGGMRAVIWTDVLQFCVMLAGMVLILGQIYFGCGASLGKFVEIAQGHDKLSMMNFGLDARTPIYALLLMSILGPFEIGGDQIQLQRYLSTKSARDCDRSIIGGALVNLPMMMLLYLTGVALFVYYQLNPDPNVAQLIASFDDPSLQQHLPAVLDRSDKILPYFIATQLPAGMLGLVLSATGAAAMSSVDSGINTLSMVVIHDLVRPLRKNPLAEHQELNLSRWLTVCWGMAAVGLAFLFPHLGTIIEGGAKTAGACLPVLIGVVLLALFSKRANALGVLLGIAVGVPVNLYIIFFTNISFPWYLSTGVISIVLVGYVASLLTERR